MWKPSARSVAAPKAIIRERTNTTISDLVGTIDMHTNKHITVPSVEVSLNHTDTLRMPSGRDVAFHYGTSISLSDLSGRSTKLGFAKAKSDSCVHFGH